MTYLARCRANGLMMNRGRFLLHWGGDAVDTNSHRGYVRLSQVWQASAGSALADTSGTPSIREASAQPACTSGLKPNASHAVDGRRTRSGMRSKELQFTGLDSTARRCVPIHRGKWSPTQNHRRRSQPRIRCCFRSDRCLSQAACSVATTGEP